MMPVQHQQLEMFATEHAASQNSLLDIHTIYYEPAVPDYWRGAEIFARFSAANRIEVASHQNIPDLYGNVEAVERWNEIKRTVLVLGVKRTLNFLPYSRNCDFVAPSHANGCASACAYCYVPRRKGYSNPVTTFVNIEQLTRSIERHAARQGQKTQPNAPDEKLWVYEIGTNNDCSIDASISGNIHDLVALFRRLPNAKATFATKYVNRDLLAYDPQGKTRIRVSLLPPQIARVTDVRTSNITDRIGAINDFVRAGYEVNINFGPVIYYDNWLQDYAQLFETIDDTLDAPAKAQLAAEVIFLTHNEGLHEVNLKWHPRAEDILWQPAAQESKISGTGGHNVRYKLDLKRRLVADFCRLLTARLPYCRIRYAF